jgi:TRAP-type C4-dicarboxylate transport system substrate-binding protein
VWEQLSKEDQDLIMSLAKEAQQRQRELWYAMEEKALADMQANGVEVIEIDDKEALREAVKPVWDKHGAQYAELIERIQAVQ